MTTAKRTIDQVISAIKALDLEPIKFKLMDKREGNGWTRAQADRYELEYKRFLTLYAKYPGELIVPSTTVDKFWHGHILDTMKYAEDCDHVFGFFLHHFPYFGLRGSDDASNLAAAALNMKRLYEQEFGVSGGTDTSYCSATDASYCSAAGASYCSATDASYCSATQVRQGNNPSLSKNLLNIDSRPTLRAA